MNAASLVLEVGDDDDRMFAIFRAQGIALYHQIVASIILFRAGCEGVQSEEIEGVISDLLMMGKKLDAMLDITSAPENDQD